MIKFKDIDNAEPFKIFQNKYQEALTAGQKSIQAVSISSYNLKRKEISSRYVNLKFVNKDRFIFFTNYNSPKSIDFMSHDNISALFYWSEINVQIRMKAVIDKTTKQYNDEYFRNRSNKKNTLAISSNQSNPISSFDLVLKKYNLVSQNENLSKCPDYWGGYSFKPYEIEIWQGNEFRLNKRDLYKKVKAAWAHFILEP